MPDLTIFMFVAMLTVMPKNQSQVNVNSDRQRLWDLAVSMSKAIQNNPDFKLFEGPAESLASATVMVTTAWGESGFREDVQYCRRKGDGGRSITTFQLMKPWALGRQIKISKQIKIGRKSVTKSYWVWKKLYTEKQLCSNTDLAADQAFYTLHHLSKVCRRGTPANLFAGYGTGKCNKRVKLTDNRCYIWSKLAKKIGLEGRIHCELKPKKITLNRTIFENNVERHSSIVAPHLKGK